MRGIGPAAVNTYARAINALSRRLQQEDHGAALVRIPKRKEPQASRQALRPERVQRLLDYSPPSESAKRAWLVALLILDTGLRISEALSLRLGEVRFEDLLLTVRMVEDGKSRVVPLCAADRKLQGTWH